MLPFTSDNYKIGVSQIYASEIGINKNPIETKPDKPNEPLIISMGNDYPPLFFVNQDGEPAGMFVDIWKLWSKKTGHKIYFHPDVFNQAIEHLRNGEADIHIGLPKSDEREKWIDFFEPIYKSHGHIFYHIRCGKFENISALSKYKFGGVKGGVGEYIIRKNYPNVSITLFNSLKETVLAVKDKQIDAFVADYLLSREIISKLGLSGEFETTEEPLYPTIFCSGIKKGNPNLYEFIENGFDLISYNEIADIEKRWIQNPEKRYFRSKIRQIKLTDKEQIWVKNHPVVELYVSEGFAPFSFVDKDGNPSGMFIDYLELFSKKTGIYFKVEKIKPWSELMPLIKNREINGIACAGKTEEREKYLTFTEPYIVMPWVIVTRNDFKGLALQFSDLEGKKVAILKGSPPEEFLKQYKHIDIIAKNRVEDIWESVSIGESDAAVSNIASASYYISKKIITNLKLSGVIKDHLELRVGVKKDFPELVSILNKSIANITPEENFAIEKKWVSIRYEQGVDWKTIYRGLFIILSFMGSIIIVILIWNRKLKEEIEQRKQAEESLSLNKERLESVLKGSQLGYWDWDITTGKVERNERWAEMLGYTLKEIELSVKQWTDLHHPDDREAAWKSINDHLEGRSDMHKIEYRMLAKDGNYKWILDCAKIVKRDAEGSPLRMSGTHTDITERKKIEEDIRKLNAELENRVLERTALFEAANYQLEETNKQLESANIQLESVNNRLNATNKELEAFSYSVSHDLRAPLRSIDGWSLALVEDFEDVIGEEGKTYIERIRTETQRMGQLIDSLLKLSRITKSEMFINQVNISDLARKVADNLKESYSENIKESYPESTVEFIIEPDLTVYADQGMMDIVLTNLIGNAFKFTGKQTIARIEFGKLPEKELSKKELPKNSLQNSEIQSEYNGKQIFFVKDNGAGFDMNYADKLFGAFQRLHKVSEFSGTGIGLATVQRIIHRHGGRVWAKGEVNKGATFYFTL
ncbi:MAG: transporter substrate-binding domain-containing protein [Desulfamplus sp.]|nr:transporter substrate-binding domain-containing protein [Desulfamplus sp.]